MALFTTRRGGRVAKKGVSIATTVKSVLALALLVLGAVQLGLFREDYPLASEVGAVNKVEKTAASKNDDACPQGSALAKPIVLNFAEIKATDNTQLRGIKEFTTPDYEQWMLGSAGEEHHILLHYLATQYSEPPKSTCPRRHLVDIGTRYVASALAMASASPAHPKILTFDIPTSMERVNAFRGKSEEDWQAAVKALNIDITFHNLDLLVVSDDDFQKYMTTWLIMLDTFHEPYSVPFEREWLKRLVDAKFFKGLILLDDIHLNSEMEMWWKELKENALHDGYIVHDLTKIGHASGTGLLDFSNGLVTVIDNI